MSPVELCQCGVLGRPLFKKNHQLPPFRASSDLTGSPMRKLKFWRDCFSWALFWSHLEMPLPGGGGNFPIIDGPRPEPRWSLRWSQSADRPKKKYFAQTQSWKGIVTVKTETWYLLNLTLNSNLAPHVIRISKFWINTSIFIYTHEQHLILIGSGILVNSPPVSMRDILKDPPAMLSAQYELGEEGEGPGEGRSGRGACDHKRWRLWKSNQTWKI